MTRVPAETDSGWRLFGRDAVKVPDGVGRHTAWRAVLRRAQAGGSPTWQRVVERVRRRAGSDPYRLVATTNRVLNGLPYRRDEGRLPGQDRWLDPDSFVRFGGDCEDYAIAKYFLLRALGVPAGRLRLVTGYDSDWASGHAVLATLVEGRVLVLDKRYGWPRPEHRYGAFMPRLSFNEVDVWLYR